MRGDKVRTYSELIQLETFSERFEYIKLGNSKIGDATFGLDRYLNQDFYRSQEWSRIRDYVILRDNGCDLACWDRQLNSRIIVHHMNPILQSDILEHSEFLVNPEYLICTSHLTHEAIHYSDENLLPYTWTPRTEGDTKLW